MNFNHYPFLKWLKDGQINNDAFNHADSMRPNELGLQMINELWKTISDNDPEIFYVTKAFQDAIEKAEPKLEQVLESDKSAGVIFKRPRIIITESYFFIRATSDSTEGKVMTFFVGECKRNLLYVAAKFKLDAEFNMYEIIFNWSLFSPNGTLSESSKPHMAKFIQNIMLYDTFMKYCDIETKTLLPKSYIIGIQCKYGNGTSFPIQILDSKWFTNLVKSDAFKVSGHFRLQPCGQAFKDKKLIWISDYMKDGYTAPAKVLKETI